MPLSEYNNPETTLLNAILPYIPLYGSFNIADIIANNQNIICKAFPDFILLDKPENTMPLDQKMKLKINFQRETTRALADTLDDSGFIERPTGRLELTEKGKKLKEAGSYQNYMKLLDKVKYKEKLKDELLQSTLKANELTIEVGKSALEVNQSILETNKSVKTTNSLQKWSLIITGVAIVGTFIQSLRPNMKNAPVTISRIDTIYFAEKPKLSDTINNTASKAGKVYKIRK